jgi:hypothetical protein
MILPSRKENLHSKGIIHKKIYTLCKSVILETQCKCNLKMEDFTKNHPEINLISLALVARDN